MRRKSAGIVVTALLAAVSWSEPQRVRAAESAPVGVQPRIVNGLPSHDYPTTAALLYTTDGGPIDLGNAGSWCSATLIGCRTVLTAAHCVELDSNPSHYWVLLQHGGIFAVQSISSHPNYNFPIADVAVIKLAQPVTGIAPTPINMQDPAPSIPAQGTIVGYGQTSGTGNDYGIKRAGLVQTTNCRPAQAGGTNTELICWDFVDPVGPAGQDSNTCNGDSGGPLFMDLGAGVVVAGVTSGGTTNSCLNGDHAYDANVYTYRNFILTQLGSDSTTTCGGLPEVGTSMVDVTPFSGTLSAGSATASYTVNVPSNAQVLRVVLNGEDNGSFDVDLYVKQGAGASPSSYDCKAEGGSVVGACEFANPAAGPWSIFLQRRRSSGEYQVTATVFRGDPPVCGNGVKEFGEQCDGGDDGACRGLCQADCTCPAPVCGNNVIEAGEECDGTDPGSCVAGTCDPDCTCPAPVCGNDIVETGEDCDGASDSACPGQCGADCTCPQTCLSDDLFTLRLRSARRFRYRAQLWNLAGDYSGLDPRRGFTLQFDQGGQIATISIPANDPGWAKSRPSRGVFKWKGDLNGILRVKLVDRSASRGFWKITVRGRAQNIDDLAVTRVRLLLDGVCTEEPFFWF